MCGFKSISKQQLFLRWVKLCGSTCNRAPGEEPDLKLEVLTLKWVYTGPRHWNRQLF